VVVIEDVITTGESALRAVDAISKAGGTILGVLAVVDREEEARGALQASGIDLLALVTAKQILRYLVET
jgi:orotate phosphoribosyltransferase